MAGVANTEPERLKIWDAKITMKSNQEDWEFAALGCKVHNCPCGTVVKCPVGKECDKVTWEDWKQTTENNSVADNELYRVRKVLENMLLL